MGTCNFSISASQPLLVVLGATGTGKTKLAVELCRKFCGEVISSDSMQLYRGLSIATNKATEEEMKGVEQHMIGFLPPTTVGYTVVNFRDEVLRLLNNIWTRGKLPVLVGGTAYYVESILWKVLLKDGEDKLEKKCSDSTLFYLQDVPKAVSELSTPDLYKHLVKVDPESARFTQPTNRRRLLRILQVFYREGKSMRELLKKQQNEPGGSSLGGPLRFANTCILWLKCNDFSALNERLDARVEKMVEAGLRQELTGFYDDYYSDYLARLQEVRSEAADEPNSPSRNYKGIFQSIALKEFLPFLSLPSDKRTDSAAEALFSEGVAQMKLATCQYARRQEKWIVNRLVKRSDREVPPIYCLRCDDLSAWERSVGLPACSIVDRFLNPTSSKSPNDLQPVSREPTDVSRNQQLNEVFYCDECDKNVPGIIQWEWHLAGRRHKWTVYDNRKKKSRELVILSGNLELRKNQKIIERKTSKDSSRSTVLTEGTSDSDSFEGIDTFFGERVQ